MIWLRWANHRSIWASHSSAGEYIYVIRTIKKFEDPVSARLLKKVTNDASDMVTLQINNKVKSFTTEIISYNSSTTT